MVIEGGRIYILTVHGGPSMKRRRRRIQDLPSTSRSPDCNKLPFSIEYLYGRLQVERGVDSFQELNVREGRDRPP